MNTHTQNNDNSINNRDPNNPNDIEQERRDLREVQQQSMVSDDIVGGQTTGLHQSVNDASGRQHHFGRAMDPSIRTDEHTLNRGAGDLGFQQRKEKCTHCDSNDCQGCAPGVKNIPVQQV